MPFVEILMFLKTSLQKSNYRRPVGSLTGRKILSRCVANIPPHFSGDIDKHKGYYFDFFLASDCCNLFYYKEAHIKFLVRFMCGVKVLFLPNFTPENLTCFPKLILGIAGISENLLLKSHLSLQNPYS